MNGGGEQKGVNIRGERKRTGAEKVGEREGNGGERERRAWLVN